MNQEQINKTDERFDKLATFLIASVAILVAITAFLQNYTANISDVARRRAQERALDATTREIYGAIQYSYQWQGAYQTWKEIDLQITAAEQSGDTAAAERYRQLKDKIAALSPMLGPDYFDPTADFYPDTYKYESDAYLVESTKLTEEYLAEAEVGRAADDISDSFIVQITLLTVSLSLYGLSITLKGRMRWLFVLVGSGIVGICLLWMGWEMLLLIARPVVSMPAINDYSEGVGLYHQGKNDEAIAKFDSALAEKPDYARAAYDRGNAYYNKGDLDRAIQDFQIASQLGLDDVNINWNLGWTEYLDGRYQEAIQTNNKVLSTDPTILGMRMNQGLTYLAMGDLINAENEYNLLIQEAERQVNEARDNNKEPSASLWYYMDAGTIDLQNLIDQLDNNPKSWTQAPTSDLITGDKDKIRSFAYRQMVRLKETIVALEYTGHLPSITEVMQVEPFVFGQITGVDEQGLISDFEENPSAVFPSGTTSVTVEFTYSGPAPQEQMVWKVYFNGTEDQAMRKWETADISTNSTWYRTFGYDYTNVFILSSGEFVVELYADSRLVQRGVFYIENP
jgi:tetratricopeptide (TPR) repeat protein